MRNQTDQRGATWKKALPIIAMTLGLLTFSLACFGCASSDQSSSSASSSSAQEESDGDLIYENMDLVYDGEPMSVFAANSAAFELSGDENACYSPASYYIALAMVAAGADGDAQQQLFAALGAQSTEELDDYCRAQLDEITSTSEETTIDISNSLWSNVGYTFLTEYQEAVEEYFDAGAFDVEFGTQQTNDMITQWISEETRGLLEPVITTDESDVATLINTLYFKDQWMEAFTEGATEPDVFHAADGDVQADFMHNTTDYGTYIEGDGFTAAQMPFSGGSTCTFFLPDAGTDLSELLETPQDIANLLAAEPNSDAQISWSVPKFEISSTFGDLIDCARELGVTDIFDPTSQDMFKNMIVADNAADLDFYINDAIQETTISLDELGVEAAAYTMLTVKATSLAPEPTETVEFVLDRPFAYVITAPNNVPLFIGVVANPSA